MSVKISKTKDLRVVFFGTPDFAVPTLKFLYENCNLVLVVTQPDKPSGRKLELSPSAVKQFAINAKIPTLQPNSIRKAGLNFITEISKFGPFDLGIVVAFGQILPQTILDLPRLGCINIHASLLPRFRGAAPIQRAIIEGDQETGVALMQMDQGLDTGAVFAEKRIKIEARDNFGSLHDKLAGLGTTLLAEKLLAIVNGELKAMPQNTSGTTYASKITPAECEINWNSSAQAIANLIRGLAPFPGAFTWYGDKRLKIFAAEAKEPFKAASPGIVSQSDRFSMEISCQSGALRILELQLEGKKRLQIDEFLKGISIDVGTKFGR